MSVPSRRGAVFVLPTTTVGQRGPVAGWISTAGWAAAAERELGQAWIVTRHGILTVAEVRRRAAPPGSSAPPPSRSVRGAVPNIVKTAVKDVREARRARSFRPDPVGPWTRAGSELAFVWQRHELFHRAGLDLATALDVPSVLFVPALTVWQAERWAVRRPGWGRWLERHGEVPALLGATLVACGTDVVAEQARRLGVPEDRLLVTPTGVDLELFSAPTDRAATREALGLDGFVIGWAGSFRPFHQLDQLVEAAGSVPAATLLLVGDGPERARIEQLADARGVPVRSTGLVAHEDLPRVLAAMDVGVVLARPDAPFHYSPLKVAEYLAAGVPVVVPDVPQLTERLDPDGNAVVVPPGDVAALAGALRALVADPARRDRLAAGARRAAPAWSWDRQVQRVCEALAARGSPERAHTRNTPRAGRRPGGRPGTGGDGPC
jgi:glycosyltransferase involved in cell wall biosynthesis